MTLETLIAEIERAMEGSTPGPWQVIETTHPWHMPESPILGIPAYEGQNYPERSGAHIERRIFTLWNHPQLKAPAPVVDGSVGVGMEPGEPVHMVWIEPENAAYIASVNPANMRLILDALTAEREARERAEELARLAYSSDEHHAVWRELKQRAETAEAERDAALLRLKTYEEADADVNAEFVRISDARWQAAKALLRPFIKISADIPEENFWPTDVFLAIRAAAAFLNNTEVENADK